MQIFLSEVWCVEIIECDTNKGEKILEKLYWNNYNEAKAYCDDYNTNDWKVIPVNYKMACGPTKLV